MPSLTLQQRRSEIDSLIDNEIFEDDKLVYSFVLNLYSNKEIDECIDYVKSICILNNEKHLIYYRLWYVSYSCLASAFISDVTSILYPANFNSLSIVS